MSAEISTKGGEVLVVEDMEGIRNMIAQTLRRAGFVVWEAAGGEEAVKLFRQKAAGIGLILLDVRLGQMDGIQTARELRVIRPDAVLCFMTGDPDNPAMAEALALSPACVFGKPFRIHDMVQEVSRLLHASFNPQDGNPSQSGGDFAGRPPPCG